MLMSERRSSSQAVYIIILASMLCLSSVIVVNEESSAYTLHAPIYIEGDTDFIPVNGVSGGTGTQADPYVIEGWEIDASTEDGIFIRATEVHFVIRDVYVHSSGTGQTGIVLIEVSNGSVEDAVLINNAIGTSLTDSENITITGGDYSNSDGSGLYAEVVANLTIDGLNSSSNGGGISLSQARDILLTGNRVSSNPKAGILVSAANNVSIIGNIVSGTDLHGLHVRGSDNVTLANNTVSSSGLYGIALESSTDFTLTNNSITNDGVFLAGQLLSHYRSHTITLDNTVNGQPLYYFKDSSDIVMDGTPAGQLLFANCTNVLVTNSTIMNTDLAVLVAFVDGASIISNNLTHNKDGISMIYSDNITAKDNDVSLNANTSITTRFSNAVTIEGNNASGITGYQWAIGSLTSTNITVVGNFVSTNTDVGIGLGDSTPALVYGNAIISNTVQGFDNRGNENSWDNGYPSGGNYWSDYTGGDQFNGPNQDIPGSDGIGDTPYVIDLNSQDKYPLMAPPSAFPIMRPPTISDAYLSGLKSENVTITWALSPDDGKGSKSVVGYIIYRGMTYDPDGLGYSLISTVPNGTSVFVDELAGEGDPNVYFYQVCSVDMNNNSTCSNSQAGKYTRPLLEGPNLISFPLIQSNRSTQTVLQTVAFDKAWAYDAHQKKWISYMPSKPHKGELKEINNKMGVWVNVTEISNLTVAGIVPLMTSIGLLPGWNLVGFPSFDTDYSVGEFKSYTNASRVEGFDPSSPPHFLRVLSDTDKLKTGYGYWVSSVVTVTWYVSVS
jgi:parallel beta-helix repeat protein